MEQNISIIDLIFSNFSLSLVKGGFELSISWSFFFFMGCMFLCYKGLRNRFKKSK